MGLLGRGKFTKYFDLKNASTKDVGTTAGTVCAGDDPRLSDTRDPKTHTHDYIPLSQKGVASGVAALDSGGKIPSTQLPSYVDDVEEYVNFAGFPVSGESGKIYIDLATNLTYRWSGTTYVEISSSLALGELSTTAYRGDRGATAYAHSQTSHNYAPLSHDHAGVYLTNITTALIEAAITGSGTDSIVTQGGVNQTNYTAFRFSSNSGSSGITKGGTTYSASYGGSGALAIYNSEAKPIGFYQNTVKKLEITSAGLVQVDTPTLSTNTTQVATTAFVMSQIANDAQPLDADLTAIAALAGTSGLLKKTAANTWALDTTAYAALASPTFTGSPAAPTATVGTATTQLATTAFVNAEIANAAQPLDGDLTAIAGLTGTSGFLKKTDTNTWSLDTSTYLTGITKAQVEAVLTGGITSHSHSYTSSIEFVIDGGGSAITTGVKGYLEIPFGCTVTNWKAFSSVSGSITVSVDQYTYANFPSSGSNICSATLSGAQKNSANISIGVTAGNIIGYNVTSATTVTCVAISLTVAR